MEIKKLIHTCNCWGFGPRFPDDSYQRGLTKLS